MPRYVEAAAKLAVGITNAGPWLRGPQKTRLEGKRAGEACVASETFEAPSDNIRCDHFLWRQSRGSSPQFLSVGRGRARQRRRNPARWRVGRGRGRGALQSL